MRNPLSDLSSALRNRHRSIPHWRRRRQRRRQRIKLTQEGGLQVPQDLRLLGVYKVEALIKEREVGEYTIEVSVQPQKRHLPEVAVVDVCHYVVQ